MSGIHWVFRYARLSFLTDLAPVLLMGLMCPHLVLVVVLFSNDGSCLNAGNGRQRRVEEPVAVAAVGAQEEKRAEGVWR